MILTHTPIDVVLRTGHAEHSPSAARFIAAARQTLGICIEACYLQTDPDVLSVYLHANRSDGSADEAAIGELFAELAGTVRPAVTLDYIDRLALWHLLSDLLPVLNRLDAVRAVGGRVYCGWDAARKGMAPYVIVSPYTLHETDLAPFRTAFAAEAEARLSRQDKWDAVTPAAMTPIVTTWDALSPDQRFALLRG